MLQMTDLAARKQAILDKISEVTALGNKLLGVTLPKINVRFDLSGRAAGQAGAKNGSYYLRFNTQHMMLGGKTWDHILNGTVPHELAHSYCQSNPRLGSQHDAGWKRVCLMLGGNGSRCYNADDAPEAVAMLYAKRKAKQVTYTTTSGATVSVSKQIHAKIQRGVTYNVRQGGQLTAQCSYSTNTQAPAVTQQTVQPKAAPVNNMPQAPKAGGSNADKVRALIAYAKARGHSADTVIAAAVAQLGMTRALAATYTKNNWNKV
jgi:predicted SprT family Zn-dependent metalloprotease